ncbi:MAG: transposase [Planctomycetaceae bacterium]|jgi:REP element-mobilizing transposase RayT|nr:transposase [Planctomycetaceae bacterium]
MAQSFARIVIHLTFSTRNRLPLINNSIKDDLWKYISGICNVLECPPVKVGGYNDHVHVCCFLSKKITIVKFTEEVKKGSSKWIKTKGSRYTDFHWQDGYGIFSVNPSELSVVCQYIDNQAEHHKKVSFQSELLAFLKKYGIEYDEKYIWA